MRICLYETILRPAPCTSTGRECLYHKRAEGLWDLRRSVCLEVATGGQFTDDQQVYLM
jgi:hypothetical protein